MHDSMAFSFLWPPYELPADGLWDSGTLIMYSASSNLNQREEWSNLSLGSFACNIHCRFSWV